MAMTFNGLAYIVKETARSLVKNSWMALASVSTVTIALFVLGFFLVLTTNVNHVTRVLQNEVELRVFLKPQANRAEEMTYLSKARQLPEVRRVTFFTKSQAAQNLKSEFPGQGDLLQVITKTNPLFDGYDVYAKNPRDIPHIAHQFNQSGLVHNVVYQGQVVSRLTRLSHVLRVAGWIIEGLLGLATLFIIVNTIRLAVFARRREVQVMKLVGATDWFIRWPFVLEGITLGLIGAVVADGIIVVGYHWVVQRASVALPFWPVAGWRSVVRVTTLFTLGGGIVVGALASMVALRRFLRI